MTLILFSAFIFFLFVLVHMILSRLTGADRFMMKVTLTFVPFGLMPFFGRFWVTAFGAQPAQKWICAAVLVSLFNMYVLALVCARNSVSLRIMDEMLSFDQGISLDDLEQMYSERESVSSRLALMTRNGYLRGRLDEVIEITEKAKKLARLTIVFRNILGITNPG